MDGIMNKQELKDKCYKDAKFLIDRGYVVDMSLEDLAKKIYGQKKGDSKVSPK